MGIADGVRLSHLMPMVLAVTWGPVDGIGPGGGIVDRGRRLFADIVALPRADGRCHALDAGDLCTIYDARPLECALFPIGPYDQPAGRGDHVRAVISVADFTCDTGVEAAPLIGDRGEVLQDEYRQALDQVSARNTARAGLMTALIDEVGADWIDRRITTTVGPPAIFFGFEMILRLALRLHLIERDQARPLGRAQSDVIKAWAEAANPHVDPAVADFVRRSAPSLRVF